jgi:CarD family transcriptional regulator
VPGGLAKPNAPTAPPQPQRPPRLSPFAVTAPLMPVQTKPLKLKVGDKAVHPKHGLGEVIAVEERELGGMKGEFYVLRILDNGMRVMVPVSSPSGLRSVMSPKEADGVLDTMRAREVAVDLQPWSRRFRAYTEMIKSGSPHEVAKVLRDMYRLKFDKDLSFGERRLLDQAKSLLMKELAAAKGMTEAALNEQVAKMFQA